MPVPTVSAVFDEWPADPASAPPADALEMLPVAETAELGDTPEFSDTLTQADEVDTLFLVDEVPASEAASTVADSELPAFQPTELPELTELAELPRAESWRPAEPPVLLDNFEFDLTPDMPGGTLVAEQWSLPEDEPELVLPEPEPTSAPASDLVSRVPDLPSAADLELGVPALESRPAAPSFDTPDFELDLGDFADESAAPQLPETSDTDDVGAAWHDRHDQPQPASAPEATETIATPETAELDDLRALADPLDAEAAAAVAVQDAEEEEQVKVIGDLRIGIPLFNIFLNEADEQSRRLSVELAEWALEHERHAVADSSIALAHSLAGNSATVGYTDLSALARALEHALMRSQAAGHGQAGEPELFSDSADEIRRLLHQFAAGFLRPVSPQLMERLADHERWPVPVVAEVEPEPMPDAEAAPGPEFEPEPEPEFPTPPEPEPELPPASEPEPELPPASEPEPELPPTDEPEPEWSPQPVVEAEATPVAIDAGPASPPALLFEPSFAPLEETGIRVSSVGSGPHARPDAFDDDQDIDAVDSLDDELFPIFEEEAEELLPQLQGRLREWCDRPSDSSAADACMRTLHTFKGGARLAGAMRLGEMAHRLETAIEHLVARDGVHAADVEPLLGRADRMAQAFDLLRHPEAAAALPEPVSAIVEDPTAGPVAVPIDLPTDPTALAEPLTVADSVVPAPPLPAAAHDVTPDHAAIDWARFSRAEVELPAAPERPGGSNAAVRVRAGLLDRLVNQAGEVSITRARIDADVRQLQGSLGELTDSLERLRRQLRDIELQAETQISSRLEAAKAASTAFDPLEMDRFTRFQELTRFMAESVNDVATLQRSLQRTLQSTEDELAAQARLTRELQDDLLRTRMVEFESMADRLYRTVRQAAKETGKQVRLDIVGGAIEIDRGVLERMTGPFEHLLRNSVAHGIELPQARRDAGKDADGHIGIQVTQTGNEVAVEFGDDGAGLDLARIRQRGIERGLIGAEQVTSDAELAQLIFAPGFSTAEMVTELAGRGVGMDVVRNEVNAMGGRIETSSSPGQGTRFRLLLPLTTAITQVVMLRCGVLSVAVPSTLIEIVRRVPQAQVDQAYASGSCDFGDEPLPFFWLPALLQSGMRSTPTGRSQTVVVVRSASQRVAVHVDEVV
ncbi:MAG: Hpt domain-containing protein, partial [Chitinophagaceae bacterium]|nr:Hpt domain-containing protein [Rubrivivax sp.]